MSVFRVEFLPLEAPGRGEAPAAGPPGRVCVRGVSRAGSSTS
jgi:hypothetical protein